MPPGNLLGMGSGSAEPVYARAVTLGEDSGRPTIDAKILTEAYRHFAQGDGATDLILVARDAAIALLVPLPEGIALAGVVAEQPFTPPATSTLPVVSGVIGALRQIADGELVILDSAGGRVLVEPAPEEFARLQAERRRPRLFIGGLHTPARTQAGRQIDVWAIVRDEADIDRAQENGADGVLILDCAAFLPEDDDGETDARPLLRAADRMGGGALGIVADPDEIDAGAILAVAARSEVRWILRPEFLAQSPQELLLDLEAYAREAAEDENVTPDKPAEEFVPPLLAALLTGGAETADFLPSGFDELFLTLDAAAQWGVSDTFDRPPIRVIVEEAILDNPFEDEPLEQPEPSDILAQAILLDVAGIAIAARRVAETKDFIRRQAY